MKKYVKPELFYEHFELTQHIAGCGWFMRPDGTAQPSPDIKEDFGLDYGETLFSFDKGCTITQDMFEDLCHENGAGPMGSLIIS